MKTQKIWNFYRNLDQNIKRIIVVTLILYILVPTSFAIYRSGLDSVWIIVLFLFGICLYIFVFLGIIVASWLLKKKYWYLTFLISPTISSVPALVVLIYLLSVSRISPHAEAIIGTIALFYILFVFTLSISTTLYLLWSSRNADN